MVVYSCLCLNIQVFGQESSKHLEGESLNASPFGVDGLLIELIDPGFHFVHKSLVNRNKNGSWTEYICVPCHMRTHAVNVKANLLFVSKDLVVGEDAVEEMKSRPEYSDALQILINEPGICKRTTGLEPQSHDALQKQLLDLQSVIGLYLTEQEEAMERRIRKYEQEQRLAFDRLAERTKEEKAGLVSTLFRNSKRSEATTNIGKVQAKSHVSLSHSKSADGYQQHHISRSMARTDASAKSMKMRESSPDVFAMEEFDIDAAEDSALRFPEKSGDANRSEEYQDSRGKFFSDAHKLDEDIDEAEDLSTMSTSVPISMPAKHFRNPRTNFAMDDDIEEAAEFSDIPRHIQQLSESIQERDRYIFGDRPRQRVHTGDFTQVKWNM